VVALKNKSDVRLVQFVALFDVEFVNGFAIEIIFANPSAIEHSDNAEQSGFSSAGRSHNGDKLGWLNIQIDTTKQKKTVRARFNGFLEIA
jgi:hypothetical protein